MPATRRRPLTGRERSDIALSNSQGGRKPIRVRGRALRPINMLKAITEGTLDPHRVSADQRRAMLVVMANGTQTSAQLGELFGVSAGTVRKDVLRIRSEIGEEVCSWTMAQVVGDLAHSAEKYSALAMQHEDPGLAWTIKRDLAKLLREWGVIGRGGGREGLTVTVEHVGASYERLKGVLALTLDPALTGEQIPGPETIEVDARVVSSSPALAAPSVEQGLSRG